MMFANYNSGNICRALELTTFANDEILAQAEQAIRLLLMPSFSPEVCLSFTCTDQKVEVEVRAAKSQIWHQTGPAPELTPIDRDIGVLNIAAFRMLKELLMQGVLEDSDGIVILDGMRVHCVLRENRQGIIDFNESVIDGSAYSAFVAQAISDAWNAIADPSARNTLRLAAGYVGPDLPEQDVPTQKIPIHTVVLGPKEVTEDLLQALKKHHQK